MGEAEPVMLDRWELQIEKNEEVAQNSNPDACGGGLPSLPLGVFNNYFSFGVDAQIAFGFREARSRCKF